MQPCDPRPESEDEVTDGKKLLGDKFVDFIPSPMRRFRADEEEKTKNTTYPGVLPELGQGWEGERLCSCTSIVGYFGTTVAQSLKSGGEVVSSNRGSRWMEEY